jgi:hypothetical protein
MRTKLTITTEHGVSALLRQILNPLMYNECQTGTPTTEEIWYFPTSEQANDAVDRVNAIKQTVSEVCVCTEDAPGCLDVDCE